MYLISGEVQLLERRQRGQLSPRDRLQLVPRRVHVSQQGRLGRHQGAQVSDLVVAHVDVGETGAGSQAVGQGRQGVVGGVQGRQGRQGGQVRGQGGQAVVGQVQDLQLGQLGQARI